MNEFLYVSYREKNTLFENQLAVIYVPNNDIRGMLLVASNISFISQLCKPSLFYFIIIFLVSLLVYTKRSSRRNYPLGAIG